MARVEINLPDDFIFSMDVPVHIFDINRAGHLGHDRILTILDEVRARFWISLGFPEMEGKRVPHIMVDAAIIYKQQAFYGQTLKIDVAATELTGKGFDLVYKISDAGSGAEIARAKTGILIYDYQKQKVAAIPDELMDKLTRQSGG